MWCLERNIHIQAQHLPGIQNCIADRESRSMRDRSDWKLDPQTFYQIQRRYGPLEVDLFASRLTYQCRRYYSWRPDPFAEAVDAFLQDWSSVRGFANPPWSLIPRVLNRVQTQEADLVLVTPLCKAQPWYALLLSMLVDWPRLLPHQELVTPVGNMSANPILVVWSISGKALKLNQGLSDQATSLIAKSWRTKTSQSYDSLFKRWDRWCSERKTDPFSGPVSEVANFLASLFEEGYQYSSVNAYRSAISSVHDKVDGLNVGQHPTIVRLLKGVFNVRPPVPQYSATWDVQKVLDFLEGGGKPSTLPLKTLTLRTVFLLAITRPSRSADLSQLDIRRMRTIANGVAFVPTVLAKQSRQGKPIEEFFFPSLQ